ncbi:MBL fold metallo-hydrolase [Roseibium sp.]|uniref:MBL fold metallo-hydrolase n=1 Tax=Roseibium sp. TaxID=1936156 RepID=UPI0032666E81
MVEMTNRSDAVPGANGRIEQLGRGCYAYCADGCANTGIVVGERGVLVIDTPATPALAEHVLEKIRELTDKPVKSVVLTHFHADSSLGTPAFEPGEVIASDLTRRMIETRGIEDIRVSRQRNPDLFSGLPEGTGVTAPTMTIASSMTMDLGGLEVRLMHLGRGHTMGDLVVWVPETGVIYAGDLVQKSAVPYCGDAHLSDWPRALDRITAFRPAVLVPGRGRIATGAQAVATAIETTRDYVTTLRDGAAACVEQSFGLGDTFLAVSDTLSPRFASRDDFEFHLPINVARAYDEALGLDLPQVWTRERLADLHDALEGIVPSAQPDGESGPAEEGETAEGATAEAAPDAKDMIQTEEDTATTEEGASQGLVSDSAFAASLAQEDGAREDGDPEEEASMDLSTEDIVEDGGNETPAPDDVADDGKVLETAR